MPGCCCGEGVCVFSGLQGILCMCMNLIVFTTTTSLLMLLMILLLLLLLLLLVVLVSCNGRFSTFVSHL